MIREGTSLASRGQGGHVQGRQFLNETFKGEVAQIRLNATMLRDEVFYSVIVRADNSARRLIPYMSALVTIDTGEAK